MQEITTIFWDLDGTLIETENLYDAAIELACKQLNVPIKRNIKDIPNGKTLRDDFTFVTYLNNNVEMEKILLDELTRIANVHIKNNLSKTQAIESTLKLLTLFHEMGLQQSIVSNSNQDLCEYAMEVLGITSLCTYCFGIDKVQRGKPEPDLYLCALMEHKILSSECITFEDSVSGAVAAKLANMTVVMIGQEQGIANPDYYWDMKKEDCVAIAGRLSKSYKWLRT